MPIYYRPPDHGESLNDKSSKGGRSTPLPVPMPPPYWGYAPPPPPTYAPPRSATPKQDVVKGDENYHYPMYPHPPYYDPYYYPPYYYGYPPMGPPYPYYAHSVSENDEYSGYSSMDEMSSYNPKRKASLERRNSLENESNSVQALKQHFELRSKSAAPRITITPTYSQENIPLAVLPSEDNYQKVEEEEEEEVEEEEPIVNHSPKLRSIKSVQNLNVYSTSEELQDDDTDSESEDSTEEETDDEEVSVVQPTEEIIPHQLSVIFEESERGESRRSFRCNSVASETTTITEHYSEEESEEDFLSRQNVQYKIKLFQETHESFSMTTARSDCEEQNESFSFQTSQTNNITEVDSDFEEDSSTKNEPEVFAIEDVPKNVTKEIEESSNEDWWGVIAEKEEEQPKETISEHVKENSTKAEPRITKCETEPNSVMVEVGDEVVCVKLRNKSLSRNHITRTQNETLTQETINNTIEKTDHNIFFSSVPQRNSIYDILKNDENEEEVENSTSGGTLMRVDSFASQLEAIKRNSGLFTLESIKQTSVIKEESPDVEESEETVETKESTEEINVASPGESSDEVDFWSQIKTDDDDFAPRRRTLYLDEENEDNQPNKTIESIAANKDSADSSNSSCSPSQENAATNVNEPVNNEVPSSEDDSDESSEEEQPLEEETVKNRSSNSRSRSLEPQTIKERIEALRNSIAKKQQKVVNDEPEEQQRIRTRISSIEVPTTESRSKTASTKSSIKSFEGYSEEEEELDSGVISDISRHISDSEEFPELRKMTRYERAATHSRLFKLLQDQDECDTEEEREEVFVTRENKFSKLSVRRSRVETHQITHSRSKLSLPLNTCISEGPPVNEKLVEELVQSLLKSKKAQAFKNMPKEKLYAAAVKILQEGIESGETPSEEFSSLLSPLRGDTQSSTPAQTPQEFYGDSAEYRQYYESWSEAAIEIMPSKAFKLLSEHIEANKLGSIEGILAKCPRILSSKNIPKEVMKLLDESDSDCSRSQIPPNSNDITNT